MPFAQDIWSDLRIAYRVARQAPVGYAVAIISLGLGLAAVTTVLALAEGLVGGDARYRDETSLVRLSATSPAACNSCLDGFSLRTYDGWRRSGLTSLDRVALFREITLRGDSDSEPPTRIAYVEQSFFEVIGSRPTLGTGFRDGRGGAAVQAIASHSFWRSRLAGDRSLVGSMLTIGGKRVTMVGVMPRGFRFPEGTDLWMTSESDASWPNDSVRDKGGIARLRPSVAAASARAELSLAVQRYADAVDKTEEGRGAVILSPEEWPERAVAGSAVWALVGAVTGVFMLCLLNLSGMFFVRVLAREREFAIRGALGATGRRIARQLLAEALMIGLAGAAIGVLMFRVLASRSHEYVASTFGLDSVPWDALPAIGIIASLGMMSGIVTLLPAALHLRTTASHEMLRGSSQTTRRQRRLRELLVIAQVTGVFTLVAAASLMMRSFMTTYRAESGMDDSTVHVAEVTLDDRSVEVDSRGRAALLLESARTAAAGADVALWTWHGLDPGNPRAIVLNATGRGDIYSAPGRVGWERPYPAISFSLTPGALTLLGIDLLEGRDFDARDDRGGEPVTIVNEEAARLLWPNGRAVGQRIKLGGETSANPWLTVIGVVKNTVHPLRLGLSQTLVTEGRYPALMFRPYEQAPGSLAVLALRARPGLELDDRQVDGILRRARPDRVKLLSSVVPMRTWMMSDGRVQTVRATTQLLAALAVAGLLIALLGVYGLVAEAVQSRRREFALRQALGATSVQLVTLLSLQLTKFLAVAVAAGMVVAAISAKAGATMLYGYQREIRTGLVFGTTASDPLIYLAALAATVIVIALGAYSPVRRAIAVAPSEALKADS